MFILKRCESEIEAEEEKKVFGGGQSKTSIQDLQPDMFAGIEIKEEQMLEIIEVDISTLHVLKRYDVPNTSNDMDITSLYNDEIVESGHGYHLFFSATEFQSGYLIITMPNLVVGIYDYLTSQLLYVFKAESKEDFSHSKFFNTHLFPGTLFWVTDKLSIYKLNSDDLLS